MTGYGIGIAGNIKIEARSFNHKHLDIQVKMPHVLYHCENDIRKAVKAKFTRGHVEISVNRADNDIVRMKINKPLAAEYYQALVSLKEELSLSGEIDINVLASYRDIFRVEDESNVEDVNEALGAALQELERTRTEEGGNLINDISARVQLLSKYIKDIGEKRSRVVGETRQKLLDRLKEFLDDIVMDEARLIQEAAVLIERADITEEIVRFNSHVGHVENLLKTGDDIGKKLDFLVQELRREVNTIGSKTNDIGIANCVIEMKHEIEKIKEQIQNLQ